jgi:hypothetical protein
VVVGRAARGGPLRCADEHPFVQSSRRIAERVAMHRDSERGEERDRAAVDEEPLDEAGHAAPS